MAPTLRVQVLATILGEAFTLNTCAISDTCSDESSLLQGLAHTRIQRAEASTPPQVITNEMWGGYVEAAASDSPPQTREQRDRGRWGGNVELLWEQHLEDHTKCPRGNSENTWVNNQFECQQRAVTAGHAFYTMSVGYHRNGHRCWSTATCDSPRHTRRNYYVFMTPHSEEASLPQGLAPQTALHSELDVAQFTPTQADWSTFQSKVDAVSSITGHDPNSVGWIRAQSWEAAQWDGTPYNPSEMSRAELTAAICPNGDTIRGIREVFYQHNPFADNANPTKTEVDNWHRIAINHVRALVGYTAPERQVHPDHCMFARALWGQQRKFTRQWDEEYPGRDGSAYGPCQGGGNSHCGATFLPSAEDQEEFLPESHPVCTQTAGSEGVFGASKSDIPWSIKWSRTLCSTLGSEGFWGGHTGPFFHREKFGFSFWDADPLDPRSNAVLRAKWTGNLMPNLYEQR